MIEINKLAEHLKLKLAFFVVFVFAPTGEVLSHYLADFFYILPAFLKLQKSECRIVHKVGDIKIFKLALVFGVIELVPQGFNHPEDAFELWRITHLPHGRAIVNNVIIKALINISDFFGV